MPLRLRFALILGLALSASALGCAEPETQPPVLSELSMSSSTLMAGSLGTISGQFRFRDPEGDALELNAKVITADGVEYPFAPFAPASLAGIVDGTITFELQINLPAPGTYTVELWLRDADGNDSNTLSAPITVN